MTWSALRTVVYGYMVDLQFWCSRNALRLNEAQQPASSDRLAEDRTDATPRPPVHRAARVGRKAAHVGAAFCEGIARRGGAGRQAFEVPNQRMERSRSAAALPGKG